MTSEAAYRILDLAPGASLQDVKDAYRDLSKVWHPDRLSSQGDRLKSRGEEKFKEISEAHDYLIRILEEEERQRKDKEIVSVTVSLRRPLVEELKQEALASGRSLSDYVSRTIQGGRIADSLRKRIHDLEEQVAAAPAQTGKLNKYKQTIKRALVFSGVVMCVYVGFMIAINLYISRMFGP
jgi:curved DNA-binding protein CbpA